MCSRGFFNGVLPEYLHGLKPATEAPLLSSVYRIRNCEDSLGHIRDAF